MATTTSLRCSLIALSLLSLAACGGAGPELRAGRFPEDVLRDPAQRFALIEQLRTRVVSRTRGVHPIRWRYLVRPALRRELERGGLDGGDVDFLLGEIDQAKPPWTHGAPSATAALTASSGRD
jgi:hypothetical protein